MQDLKALLGAKSLKKSEKREPNSYKVHVCVLIMQLMGEDKTLPEEYEMEMKHGTGKQAKKKRVSTRIKYWLGRTRGIDPQYIEKEMLKLAQQKNEPRKYFNWLLRHKKEQMRALSTGATFTQSHKNTKL